MYCYTLISILKLLKINKLKVLYAHTAELLCNVEGSTKFSESDNCMNKLILFNQLNGRLSY